jgi:thiol-disulfide isomerase/thioredoxin
METGVRQLQKEFPKRDEINSLLLAVAQGRLDNNQVEQSRALVEEVLKSKPEGEAKEEAEGLLKKVNLIGKPLALKYKALDARDVDVQQMKGKVVLVDFWATWCGPCMHELPHVKEAYQKLHDKGFEIVGISFDREKAALEKTVQEEKIPWPQFLDGETGQKFGEQFGISGIPTFWLVDKKGVLRDVNGTENLVEKVEKLLAEN